MYTTYRERVAQCLERDGRLWHHERYNDVVHLQDCVVWKSKLEDFRGVEARWWEALNIHQKLMKGKYQDFREELKKCTPAYARFRDGKELADELVKMVYSTYDGSGSVYVGGWYEDPLVQKAQYGELEEMPTLITDGVPEEARKIAQERLENGEGPRLILRQDLYDLYTSNERRFRHIYHVRGVCAEIMSTIIHQRYHQHVQRCPRWQQHFIDVIANGRRYLYTYNKRDDHKGGYWPSLLRTPEDGSYVEDFDTGQYASEHLLND